ncbi:MobC family plasmid mobilization relaxosome protein [Curtobacterium sp. MCBD17_026]|uniref:MobC family plasmid mobilization relaxosome protein n=1 Tax=Curtobacterium sp. MCBD17_026 TaxID=2175621 RepID=UPI000DA941E1|nr:MobC family plasmid mobilization relaxosome protein [Curtobacterium sp. MCBD17_026]WIB72598.1 MobC family plasmid mobilization relaxosome protein [Curtobacterium sp. MCBD17_026]
MGAEDAGAKVQRRRRVQGGRPHRHIVRATDEEEARLLALAAPRKISVAKLLVESALSGGADAAASSAAMREDLLPALFHARRLLAGIATNVNQMAKVANATGSVPSETDATLVAVQRTADRLDELVADLAAVIR